MKPLRPVRPRIPAEMPAMDASDVRLKKENFQAIRYNKSRTNGNKNTAL